jgi:hypothetical protein
MIRFEKTSGRHIKVTCDGILIGWLERSSHKPAGYSGKISGKEVRADTLTRARQIIEGAA